MAEPEPSATKKRGTFYRIRVAVLLMILAGVLLYAWNDVRKRRARNEWKRPLLIAFVVVRDGPITKESVHALQGRVGVLQKRLSDEMQRFTVGPEPPFEITIFGPVDGADAPPEPPVETGLVPAAKYQWKLDRWVSKVDSLAGLETAGFDSRIYLFARPPADKRCKQIEGASEKGGRVGVVRVELDDTMADLTLFVATHELLHTLGASDKYAVDGSVDVPDGLAEPDLVPLYPQRLVEIMARHRPLAPGQSKPPLDLSELAVGQKTAREIGWLR